MKKAILLLVLILLRYGTSFSQTTIVCPDTTVVNDTTWFTVNYTGPTANPIFKWIITDSIGGYNTINMTYPYNPRYKMGTETTFSYVFEQGGNYDIILETPETTMRRRVNVWEPRRVGACGFYANDICGNMLLNGRFEDFTAVPVHDEDPMDNKLCRWTVARAINPTTGNVHQVGTPDFFTPGATGMMPGDYDVSPPYCTLAYQESHGSGFNFVGFGAFSSNQTTGPYYDGGNTTRECLQQILPTPLLPGRTYKISAWVSLADESTHATKFSFLFTASLPKYNNHPIQPTTSEGMIINFPPVTQRTGWAYVTQTFTYTGTSPGNYLTIGNWNTATNSNITIPPTPPTLFPWPQPGSHCYYLMDDLELLEINSPCCKEYDVWINGRQSPKNISDFNILPGQKIFIEGEVIINQYFAFNNNEVVFGPYAKVTVQNGIIFRAINNSYLHACDVMWQGIYASNVGSQVNILDSKIEDALEAINVSNGARVNSINSTFNMNQNSIRYSNWNATYPTTVSKTYFNSSYTLKSPRWNKKSYSHIIADSAGTLNLTPTDVTNYNRYYNANFGITANKTALVVSNSRFVNIKNYDAGHSVAIVANNYPINPYGGPKYVNVSDLASGAVNNFLNCDNGILLNGYLTYQVFQNTFQNIQFKAINGVNNAPMPGSASIPDLQVYRNTITNVMRGIDLVDFSGSTVLVDNNTINNSTANPNTCGIRLSNSLPIPAGHACSNTYPAYIHKVVNNRIDKFGVGIKSNSVKCLLIDNNNVFPKAQASGEFVGIHTSSSNQVIVSNNHVIGDVSDWRITGIRSDNSMGGKFRCNVTEKCGPAFMFGGSASGYVAMYNNDMYNAQSGVYLNYAEIGYQVGASSQHNRWNGSFTNHLYVYNSFGPNSRFYFENGTQGTPLWPLPLKSNGNDTVFFQSIPNPPPTASYDSDLWGNCSLGWYGGERSLDSIKLLESVQRIVTQATIPPAYVDEVNYLRKLTAYSAVMDNPWLLGATPEISDFMTDTGEYTKIYKALKYIEYGSYTNAIDHLNAINISDSVNEALITSALVYISLQKTAYGKQDINELPKIADLLVLREYAEKCIYQYNDGTLASRLLLEKMFGWEIDSDCEEPKSKPTPTARPAPELRLYPNPTSNTINIELLNANENGLYSLILYDITGKQVYQTYLYTGLQIINLPDLPDGLYIYRTNSENSILSTGKLVIKK